MPLSPGDQLGPYAILSAIGAGGMGEVYKARDTRLDRTVAIKVLPEHIARRDDLRARFEREARAVASLNHPNICTLYDIGTQDGGGYMVMEHLEGETLAGRIERGALPLDEALRLAVQIADALDRAHRAGVTHRDIKPQNIVITRDGAKVLDFGLAKAESQAGPAAETIVKVLTTEGTVLGTPQYMAPEQFEGREADARSDIWAFGAVLYEMLTGRKAFEGASYSSLVGSILAKDPAPMAVTPFTPEWLERLVRRCLNKDPERRYQSMRDIALDLESPPPQAQPAAPLKPPGRWLWAVGAAAVLAAAGLGVWMVMRANTAPPPQTVELDLHVPGGASAVFVSPDGKTIAWNDDRELRLWLRPIGSARARPTEVMNPQSLAWSPDGRWISYLSRGALHKLEISTGVVQTVAPGSSLGSGTAWTPDGQILVGQLRGPILRIGASGGRAVPAFELDGKFGEVSQQGPVVMEDGQGILFRSNRGGAEQSGIYLGRLDGKRPPRRIYPNLAFRYVAPNTLIVRGNNRVMAVRFNPQSGEIGEPLLISDNEVQSFSASADGRVIAIAGAQKLPEELSLYDRSGRKLETIPAAAPYQNAHVEFSPDGRRLLLERNTSENIDLWTVELGRKVVSRLTFNEAIETCGVWSADGQTVYYYSSRPQLGGAIYSIPSNGTGAEKLVHKVQTHHMHASPNGQYLLFERGGSGRGFDYLDLRDGNKPGKYLDTGGMSPQFSPDSKLVAYESSETGRAEIYVQAFPAGGGKWQISTQGGIEPRWRGDGREIFYTDAAGVVYAAAVEVRNGSLEVAATRELFRFRRGRAQGTAIAVSPDGKLFAIRESPSGGEASITVRLNWPLPAK